MITHDVTAASSLLLFGAAGVAVGLGYFALVRRSAARFATAGGRAHVITPALLRLAGAATFFWLAVRQGALPLLGAFLGFLIARSLSLRRARKIP